MNAQKLVEEAINELYNYTLNHEYSNGWFVHLKPSVSGIAAFTFSYGGCAVNVRGFYADNPMKAPVGVILISTKEEGFVISPIEKINLHDPNSLAQCRGKITTLLMTHS